MENDQMADAPAVETPLDADARFVGSALRVWETNGIHGNWRDPLIGFGMNVICARNMRNRSFLGSRLRKLPGLRPLADAAESSRLITGRRDMTVWLGKEDLFPAVPSR